MVAVDSLVTLFLPPQSFPCAAPTSQVSWGSTIKPRGPQGRIAYEDGIVVQTEPLEQPTASFWRRLIHRARKARKIVYANVPVAVVSEQSVTTTDALVFAWHFVVAFAVLVFTGLVHRTAQMRGKSAHRVEERTRIQDATFRGKHLERMLVVAV